METLGIYLNYKTRRTVQTQLCRLKSRESGLWLWGKVSHSLRSITLRKRSPCVKQQIYQHFVALQRLPHFTLVPSTALVIILAILSLQPCSHCFCSTELLPHLPEILPTQIYGRRNYRISKCRIVPSHICHQGELATAIGEANQTLVQWCVNLDFRQHWSTYPTAITLI